MEDCFSSNYIRNLSLWNDVVQNAGVVKLNLPRPLGKGNVVKLAPSFR